MHSPTVLQFPAISLWAGTQTRLIRNKLDATVNEVMYSLTNYYKRAVSELEASIAAPLSKWVYISLKQADSTVVWYPETRGAPSTSDRRLQLQPFFLASVYQWKRQQNPRRCVSRGGTVHRWFRDAVNPIVSNDIEIVRGRDKKPHCVENPQLT